MENIKQNFLKIDLPGIIYVKDLARVIYNEQNGFLGVYYYDAHGHTSFNNVPKDVAMSSFEILKPLFDHQFMYRDANGGTYKMLINFEYLLSTHYNKIKSSIYLKYVDYYDHLSGDFIVDDDIFDGLVESFKL